MHFLENNHNNHSLEILLLDSSSRRNSLTPSYNYTLQRVEWTQAKWWFSPKENLPPIVPFLKSLLFVPCRERGYISESSSHSPLTFSKLCDHEPLIQFHGSLVKISKALDVVLELPEPRRVHIFVSLLILVFHSLVLPIEHVDDHLWLNNATALEVSWGSNVQQRADNHHKTQNLKNFNRNVL